MQAVNKNSITKLTYKGYNAELTIEKDAQTGGENLPAPQIEQTAQPEEAREDELLIKSPTVGIFFAAATPDSPALTKAGEHKAKGDTLCFIEAMKMQNEVTCDFDCVIDRVLIKNGDNVEYDQPLFKIKKV